MDSKEGFLQPKKTILQHIFQLLHGPTQELL